MPRCDIQMDSTTGRFHREKPAWHSGDGPFFYPLPIAFGPAADGHLVALLGPTLGPLTRQTQLLEQTGHISDMVLNAILSLNEFANTGSSPEIGVESTGASALEQSLDQVLSLPSRQLRFGSQLWLELQTLFAPFAKSLQCQMKPSQRAIEQRCDHRWRHPLLVQLYGFQPNNFQLFWASMPSHVRWNSTLRGIRKYQSMSQ